MRLTDLNPRLRHPDIKAPTVSEAYGVEFTCPCGKHQLWCNFQNRYGGTTGWAATGTDVNDLTFHDSPLGTRSVRYLGPCKAHFNITNGALDFYDDSGVRA